MNEYMQYLNTVYTQSKSNNDHWAVQVLRCWLMVKLSDVPTHLDPLPLHLDQAVPPQTGWTEVWMCPSLLPLLLCPPPSTSPLHPLLHLVLSLYPSSPQVCCPFARLVLGNSFPLARSSGSLGGRTPHPSPSHLQSRKEKKENQRKTQHDKMNAKVRWAKT